MPEVSDDAAIIARGLVKTYRLYGSMTQMALDRLGLYNALFWRRPEFKEFDALAGLDLKVAHGERVAIIGRNGAGKTTLLKLLTGNFAPTAGDLKVNGSIQALMHTGLGFHPEFTGLENIRSGLEHNGLSGKDLADAVAEVVDFVELGEYLNQPMSTYSAGMQARVQFATATAIKPDILIIDEILGAGDAYFTGKSAHRMRKLTSGGCTLIFVSHAMDQVLQFCDRAIWLDKGRIRMQGNVLHVVRAYEEFIAVLADQHSSQAEHGGGDRATPPWRQEAMADLLLQSPDHSTDISRWPGIPGLLITRLAMASADGSEKSVFNSGEDIRVRVTVSLERPGTFRVRFALLFMTVAGNAITRLLSPYFDFHSESAGEKQFEVLIAQNLFAAQTVVFSVAAFQHYEPERPEDSVRYDLLTRSFQFRIIGGVPNDPGIVTLPARWAEVSA